MARALWYRHTVVSVNRGNNGFGAMSRVSAGVILLAFLTKGPGIAPKLQRTALRRRRGRFARPQGEGWLPPAEAENAANVALRLPGGAVSPCLPML